MDKVGFFTPLKHQDKSNSYLTSAGDLIESYFYVSGKRAYVLHDSPNEAVVSPDAIPTYQKVIKIIYYITVAIPLTMLALRTALRCTYDITVVDMKSEKDLDIPDDLLDRIGQVMEDVQKGRQSDEITILSGRATIVFSLKSHPEFIFKVGNRFINNGIHYNERIKRRYANILDGAAACKAHQLGLLHIPQSRVVEASSEGRKYKVLVQKRMDIETNLSRLEDQYETGGDMLVDTARQLAQFIAVTGFYDSARRNMPLMHARDAIGRRQVALVDLEQMRNAQWGFDGDRAGNAGLINSLGDKEQIDIAVKEAKKYGITPSEDVKRDRLKEIKHNRDLAAFHESKGITTGDELLVVDPAELGLDLDRTPKRGMREEEKGVTMREAIVDVVNFINATIQKKSCKADDTPKEKRIVSFQYGYDHLKHASYRFGCPQTERFIPEDLKPSWLNEILKALIAKGHLFSMGVSPGINARYVQA